MTDINDRDPCANFHKGDPESIAAHEFAKRHKSLDHRRILDFGKTRGAAGMTCYEAEVALHIMHQTCSARFTELKQSNQLLPTGEKRLTGGRCKAKVYIVAQNI